MLGASCPPEFYVRAPSDCRVYLHVCRIW